MSTDHRPLYTVHRCRMGTVHIVRWWEVRRDGKTLDYYDDESLARGYADYMNRRRLE